MNIKINPASAGLNWLPKPAAGPRPDLTPTRDLAVQPALVEVPAPAGAEDTASSAASLFQPLMRGLDEWSRGVSGAAHAALSAEQSIGALANARPDYAGSFSLTVKTRDGDTVTLHFDQARTHGPQMSRSNAATYRVEGIQGGNAERAYSSLSFSYETDLETKTQRLSSEMLDGYQQKDGVGMHRYAYGLRLETRAGID